MQNPKNLISISVKTISIIAVISLLAVGCNNNPNSLKRPEAETNTTSQNNSNNNTANANIDNGQVAGSLTPLPTKKIKVGNKELSVEVADNDTTREQGLSERQKLDEGTGMLFDFTNTNFRMPGFWMKGMLMSIDIIWINNDKVVGAEQNAPLPPQDSDLPVYYPPSEVTHVLEVPAGWYKQNNISVGTTVSL